MKAKSKNSRSQSKNLFDLAQAVSVLYGQKCAKVATEEFREVAFDYRNLKKESGQAEWLTYVLQVLLTCPVLLERPKGFEWVTNDLQWALTHRRVNQKVDRDFWKAMTTVRGKVTKARPDSKGRDLFRYQMVEAIMNPVTTDPKMGLVKTQGISKSHAVETVAEMESKWSGKIQDPRVIWRSLQRVEANFEKILSQLK